VFKVGKANEGPQAQMNLIEAIEELVRGGMCGPWVIGSYMCELCGAAKKCVTPLCDRHHPLREVLKCDECGQNQGRYLYLNSGVHD
jgi:hypothetical protein